MPIHSLRPPDFGAREFRTCDSGLRNKRREGEPKRWRKRKEESEMDLGVEM
jgi:hypothetical protein